MEENKQEVNEQEVKQNQKETTSNKQENAKQGNSINISTQTLSLILAAAAICLYVLYEIILHFGEFSYTLAGVFSIFMYILPLAGIVIAFLKDRKTSFEFWVNAVVFCIIALTI